MRLRSLAIRIVVPDPQKGSNTTSPGQVDSKMQRRGSSSGKGAGWPLRTVTDGISQTFCVQVPTTLGRCRCARCGRGSIAEEARSSNADVVEVEFDPQEGYPRRIDIDYKREAIDDESCFVITDYKADS
jgi:hypothetical protein